MKYLQLCSILLAVGISLVEIECFPIENSDHQVAVLLPEYTQADLPASATNPEQSIITPLPLTLLDVEDYNKSSGDVTKDHQRRARFLALGGLGNKFSGLGLGGFGGLGSWGLGGLHGFGLGGFKPFFGHFG